MATHNTATSVANSGAFKGLKTPRELLNYNLMRGVTDFSNLKQWDLYEKGYPFLVVVSIPDFLKDLAARDDNVKPSLTTMSIFLKMTSVVSITLIISLVNLVVKLPTVLDRFN